jgi:sodium transport system ATP-binding protein
MSEVERLCSRVAVIYRGRLQAQGPIGELLATYDQPNIEELFFALVEKADAEHQAAEPGAGAAS